MNVRENSECYRWRRIISNPIHHSNELQLGLLRVQTNNSILAKKFHLITHFVTSLLEITHMHGCFISKFMSSHVLFVSVLTALFADLLATSDFCSKRKLYIDICSGNSLNQQYSDSAYRRFGSM